MSRVVSLRTAVSALLVGSALLAALPASAESFVTFQIAGGSEVQPVKINAVGTIAGSYTASGQLRGFVRSAGGQIATFDVDGYDTTPTSIGDDGTVVGYYTAGTALHGFRRDPGGTITRLSGPGTFTVPNAINSAGALGGFYRADGSGTNLGFLATADGTLTATVTPPADASGSVVNTLNDLGASAGYFEYALKHTAFVRAADGTVTSFEGVSTEPDPRVTRQTEAVGINNAGTVAGVFRNLVCPESCGTVTSKGFVRDANGQLTLFTVGGRFKYTDVTAINNVGQVTGYYSASRTSTGYVRNADGAVTTFQVPAMVYTRPTSINDQGTVTGVAIGSDDQSIGFVRTP